MVLRRKLLTAQAAQVGELEAHGKAVVTHRSCERVVPSTDDRTKAATRRTDLVLDSNGRIRGGEAMEAPSVRRS